MRTFRICKMQGMYDVICCEIYATSEYRALQSFKKTLINEGDLKFEKILNHWQLQNNRGALWTAIEQIGI